MRNRPDLQRARRSLASAAQTREGEICRHGTPDGEPEELTEVLGTCQLEIEAEVEKLSDLDDLVRKLRYENPGFISITRLCQ